MTPLAVCEALIGRPEILGAIIGINIKSPYAWRERRGLREAGDFPEVIYQRRLLAHSDAHGLGLTALHLVCGAEPAEVAAILAARARDPETDPDFTPRRALTAKLEAAE